MCHQCSIYAAGTLISLSEPCEKRQKQCIQCRKLQVERNNNAAKCSLKWDVYDVQGVSVVVTWGNSTFPLRSKLHPEQSLLLSVYCQCFRLFSHFNERSFLLTRHIRSLDAWSSLTRQPKEKPAKCVSSSEKWLTLECSKTSHFWYFQDGTEKLDFVIADTSFLFNT